MNSAEAAITDDVPALVARLHRSGVAATIEPDRLAAIIRRGRAQRVAAGVGEHVEDDATLRRIAALADKGAPNASP